MNSITQAIDIAQPTKAIASTNKRSQQKSDSGFSRFVENARDRHDSRNKRQSESVDEKSKENELKPDSDSDAKVKRNQPADQSDQVENNFRSQLGLDLVDPNMNQPDVEPVPVSFDLELDQPLESAPTLNPLLEEQAPFNESDLGESIAATDSATLPLATTPDSEAGLLADDLTTRAESLESMSDSEAAETLDFQDVSENVGAIDNSGQSDNPLRDVTHAVEAQVVKSTNDVPPTVAEIAEESTKLSENKAEASAGPSSDSNRNLRSNLAEIDQPEALGLEDPLISGDELESSFGAKSLEGPMIESNSSAHDFESTPNMQLASGIGAGQKAVQAQQPHVQYSPEVVKNITQTVTENLVQEAKYSESGTNKQLIVHLHPAELGQVVLQVDWDNDVLKAKIVASEMAASEILNQQKPQLVSALAESGLNFDSLDVTFKNAPQDQQDSNASQNSTQPSALEGDGEIQSPETTIQLDNPSESRIDLVA